ncbi:hypothetical protein FRB94_007240 [Tulasnella sp. JGI-2019a]|nr:hypothetical protein FRB94_007240 [Tulasnella sp. JGI-2019a]
MSQALASSTKPCSYYARGACKEGATCRFSHNSGRTTLQKPTTSPTSSTSLKTYRPGVCAFWAQRRCTKGDSCAYSHSDTDTSPLDQAWRKKSSIPPPTVSQSHPEPASGTWAAAWSPQLPCKYWQEGGCAKGATCTFSHGSVAVKSASPISPSNHTSPLVATSGPETSEVMSAFNALNLVTPSETHKFGTSGTPVPTKPCKFWQEGKCFKGTACPYGHWGSGATLVGTTVANTLSPEIQVAPTKAVCNFWVQGHCRFGSSCLLGHPPTPTSPGAPPNVVPGPANFPGTGVLRDVVNLQSAVERSYGGARTSFGPGGEVLTIITSLESSRLIITGLPAYYTLERLKDMLDPFPGVIHSKLADGTTRTKQSLSASVEFARPNQASEAYAALEDATVDSGHLSCRLEKPYQHGSGSLRTTTVQLSWRAPACMAFVHYSTRPEATQHAHYLDGKFFRGSKVSAVLMTQEGGLTTVRRGRRYTTMVSTPSNYTVLIKGLPVDAGDEDVEEWASADSVDLRHTYEEEEGMEAMEALMEGIGPIVSFRRLHRTAQRQKCLVTFQDADAVVTAVARYNGTQQPVLGKGILYVKSLWSIRLYVLARHFAVIGQELQEIRARLQEVQGGTHLYIESGETKTGLTLSGDDPKDFAAVKRTVQQLIDGEPILGDDGSLVWDSFFDTSAGTAFLHEINQQSGYFVFRNSKRQMLTLSGTHAAKAIAREQILVQVGKQRLIGPLDPQTWRQLLSEDLKELEAEIGEEKVVLDVTRRLLVIRGTEEAFRAAKTFVQNISASGREGRPTATDACPVCFCDPTNGVQLGCGHGYCNACLKDYLLSASNSKSFPVLCVAAAAQGTCAIPVSLDIVRRILTTDQERVFFNAAFSAYVQKNPKEIRYCPSADCEWVYRPQPSGLSIVLCETCLQRVCAACHVTAHEGLTCQEYKEVGTPEGLAMLRYKKENNIKACPGCNVDIVKDGGCNHVACSRCQAHICWVCMKIFSKSREVYDHMSATHGGFGL